MSVMAAYGVKETYLSGALLHRRLYLGQLEELIKKQTEYDDEHCTAVNK